MRSSFPAAAASVLVSGLLPWAQLSWQEVLGIESQLGAWHSAPGPMGLCSASSLAMGASPLNLLD